jgi:glycosyltransferase involved in cell wall biosynthesis
MLISVCICTRNRAQSLARTLHAIERCVPPTGEWELLIVDNGSTDGTLACLATFEGRLPIRIEHEPAPGASRARNKAVLSARGTYMIWTDDDTVPEPGWITAYLDAFTAHPDAVLFGGRIIPALEEPAAPWFREALAVLALPVAHRDFGSHSIPLDVARDHVPFGANFAIRTDIQRQFPYDVSLGPGAPYFGEETTVFEAILHAGHAGAWVPGSVVSHMIPATRQTERYVAWWYGTLGKTQARLHTVPPGKRMLGAPLWMWRKWAETALAYRWARYTAPAPVWVAKLIRASLAKGAWEYCLAERPR